jgi:hypothetical protein
MLIKKVSRLEFLIELSKSASFNNDKFVLFNPNNNELIRFNFNSFIETYFQGNYVVGIMGKGGIICFDDNLYFVDYSLDEDDDIDKFFKFYIDKYYNEVF